MYKPSEASQLLDIPESTLRRLAQQLSEYLSPQTGRKRRYTERDLSTLQTARAMLERGLTIALVRAELEKVIELNSEEQQPETESEPETSSPVMRQLAIMDKQYTGLLGELERMREESERNKQQLARLEAFLALPWWKRLFSSPPKP